MIALLVRAAGLAGIYLLVLTSLHPGDVLVGAGLGLALAGVFRGRRGSERGAHPSATIDRLWAAAGLATETAREMVVGTWRTIRFCLGWPAQPGFVEIPRAGRSRRSVALWGVLTGESPDEFPVDVEEERDVLIVHLVDAGDPDGVRDRHRRNWERWHRRVAP